MEREPTSDQRRILEARDRIRVVKAAPGSGKTWVIAEAFRRAHREWADQRGGGIAALSFTNVARDEIGRALGGEPRYPHVVRTLDSFLFRYVVRPFLPSVGEDFRRVRLIPADQVSFVHQISREDLLLRIPGEGNRRASILKFAFVGEEEGRPLFSVPMRWREPKLLSLDESIWVYQKKQEFWKRTNCVSHSDVAFLAASLLSARDRKWLEPVLTLLSRRFPEFIVDELQDTGWFRAQALLRLLERTEVKALLVGDPDQAIFEFAGASPAVLKEFGELPGARVFAMEESIRCPARVCDVASELGSEDRVIRPRRGEAAGEAFLIPHDGTPIGLREWLERIPPSGSNTRLTVVARENRTVSDIRGEPASQAPRYQSRPVSYIDEAVRAFRQHNNPKALLGVSAAFSKVLFGTGLVPDEGYGALNTTEFQWRKECVRFLLRAHKEARGCSCWDWGCRMATVLREHLTGLGWWDLAPNRTTPRRPVGSMSRDARWPDGSAEDSSNSFGFVSSRWVVKTVHKSKGETHDITVCFVRDPPPGNLARCPANAWWDEVSNSGEERRIAYVAATRATGWFVLAVSEGSLKRLKEHRPQFVERFTVLDDFSGLPTELPGRPLPLA